MNPTQTPNRFEVRSAQRTYPVEFYPSIRGVLSQLEAIKNPVFLVDANVRRLYGEAFRSLFTRFPTLEIDATEDSKTFEGVGRVVEWMSENKCTKSHHVVAIGGGIVQDISAFSASIFYRGLPWTLVPTTLLAMADSCIGAKCGVNLKSYKNQLGVFNSPHAILISMEFLGTLTETDIKSGYGEILKLHLTAGYEKFLELESDLNRIPKLLSDLTVKHVSDSLSIKREIIEQDEYEQYLRMILNYGHTFGHALEAETQNFVPHGLGICFGMDFVNFLAVKEGWLDERKFLRIQKFIHQRLHFKNIHPVTASGLINASKRDKKVVGGSEVNMVYFTDQNKLEIKKTKLDEAFNKNLTEYLARYDVFAPISASSD